MPAWLKDFRKSVPMAAVLALLLALAVIPKGSDGGTLRADGESPAGRDDRAGDAGTGGVAPGASGSARPTAPGSKGGTGGSGAGTAGGSTSGTVPGVRPGTPITGGASYQGVTSKTVKMGFTWQHAQCGNFFGPGIAAAFGVPQPEEETSIRAAIEYFERHPDKAFPAMPAAMRAGVNVKNGYWGRRITPVFEDNGGPLCGDKARATAVKLAEQDKVFGTIQIPNDGANQFIAPEMAARKLVNIGAPGMTRALYRKWEPFVYDVTFSGTDVVEAWSSWACRDLVRKKSFDTGDTFTANKVRNFAIVYQENPIAKTLVDQAKRGIAACGGKFALAIGYPADIDKQASAASNAIAQMRSQNVTTVYMLTDPLFSATLTSASTSQAFFPEWSVSAFGFNDVAFVVQHFYDEQQRKNVFGASHLSSSTAPVWSESTAYKAWKTVRPDREPPGDWNNWYLSISVLYVGMAGAGPDLTPAHLLGGLATLCNPCQRASVRDVGLGFSPGDTTGVDDFTLVRFNVNKVNRHDPGDGTGRSARGDWDFPEKGVRYFRTVRRPLG